MLLKIKGAVKIARVYLNRFFWGDINQNWNEVDKTWDQE